MNDNKIQIKPTIVKPSLNVIGHNLHSIQLVNVDNLPQTMEVPRQQYRTQSNHLFNLVQKERLQQQANLMPNRSASINLPARRTIDIHDDQSNEGGSGVRVIDPSILAEPKVRIYTAVQENKMIASMSREEKARKLRASIQDTKETLKHLEQENGTEKSLPTIHYVSRDNLNRKLAGRSKSLNSGKEKDFKFSFKIGGLTKNPKRVYAAKIGPMQKLDRDPEWLSNALSNVGTSSESNSRRESAHSDDVLMKEAKYEFNAEWNKSNTSCRVPNSSIILDKSEFGLLDMNALSMVKLNAVLGKTFKTNNDDLDFPKMSPSMACGHKFSTECFDELMLRIKHPNGPYEINGKKPHQYSSIEYRETIAALVQNNGNNCRNISIDDINQAFDKTKLHERIKTSYEFDWTRFVHFYRNDRKIAIRLASSELFMNQVPSIALNTFEIGQKLEAIDPQNSGLFCVCTIIDKCGYRIKLHFDGYSSMYDFWLNADSVNIFPAGYCNKTGRQLEPPGHDVILQTQPFNWYEYFKQTNTIAAHRTCFTHLNNAVSVIKEVRSSSSTKLILKSLPSKKTNVNPFKKDMKLEAEHMRLQRFCAATVGDVIDSRILIKLDNFDETTNYWTDITSPHIHPINWHLEAGFSIERPPGIFFFCFDRKY